MFVQYYDVVKSLIFENLKLPRQNSNILTTLICYPLVLILVFYIIPALIWKIIRLPITIINLFYSLYIRIFWKKSLQLEQQKLEKQVYQSLSSHNLSGTYQIPRNGWKLSTIIERQKNFLLQDKSLESDKLSGMKYSNNKEFDYHVKEFIKEFILHNPLHFDIFRGARQMEAELISMTSNILGSGKCIPFGVTTSGGSESNMLALYTYRQWAKETKGIINPEIIILETAHASFIKACKYYGIQYRVVNVSRKTFLPSISDIKNNINSNTICLIASAPNYTHGLIDPIEEIGVLAHQKGLGFHIDACLGGFILPFLESKAFPRINFSLKGLTSISIDYHKYGLAPKGLSGVFYNSKELRHFQYFSNSQWPGGIYVTPTAAGSRSAAPIAGAWFSMVYNGLQGFKNQAVSIINSVEELKNGLLEIKEIKIIGDPKLCVVAFKSEHKKLNIFTLREFLNKKDWKLTAMQKPDAIHFAVTLANMKKIKTLVEDIKNGVNAIIKGEFKEKGVEGNIFGTMKNIKDERLADEFLKSVLDASLKA